MAGDFVSQERDSFRDEPSLRTRPVTTDCFYLGGIMQMVPDGCGCRIGGFGEAYCVLMHRLPCPEDCPDRKAKG